MDSIRRQFEKEATQTIADFEAYSKKAREEYEKYEAQARADYSRYTRSIKQTWGGDSIVDNTPIIKIVRSLILIKEKFSWKSHLRMATRWIPPR